MQLFIVAHRSGLETSPEAARIFKILPSDTFVIHDGIDLLPGSLTLKRGGSVRLSLGPMA
jgi:peptidyl-tRNA hydrolase